MKTKESHIIIDSEKAFSDEFGNRFDSYYGKVRHTSVHFKNINFNLLEPKALRIVVANKMIFENCILGNLHYMELSSCDEIHLINQEIDSYFINNANPIRKLYLNNNSLSSLTLLINRGYDVLSIKNNNIKGQLKLLDKTFISTLMLESYEKYSISDLEYLKNQMKNNKIRKLFFNEIEIDEKKLFYLERKVKVQKLIKINA